MAEYEFPRKKWLRLHDALALVCTRLDTEAAKQEICDSVITGQLMMRGEWNDQYVFFDSPRETVKLIPSNIDWVEAKIYKFIDDRYIAANNLCVLNDERFQALVLGQSTDNPKSSEPVPVEVRTKSRGGRPENYPWDDIWVEICRIIHEEGVPATRAELMEKVQQWCEDHYGNQPADSTLKPKIGKLYRVLRNKDENWFSSVFVHYRRTSRGHCPHITANDGTSYCHRWRIELWHNDVSDTRRPECVAAP
jgi:hypothetical protein